MLMNAFSMRKVYLLVRQPRPSDEWTNHGLGRLNRLVLWWWMRHPIDLSWRIGDGLLLLLGVHRD